MKFSVFQVSSQGGRKKNEDRMGYCYTRESGLFLLADGMGGHPQGEIAAELALQSCSALFQQRARPLLADTAEFLVEALQAAHQRIMAHSVARKLGDSPRTTLVAAVVQQSCVSWIHCGDSRLYLVRDGRLLLRTRDHSYAEHATQLPERPLQFNRNVLFTCVGSPTEPMYDLSEPFALRHGDRLLLCSDGLWGALPDDEIVLRLARRPVAQSVPELVDEALARAGATSDNVTALALEWEAPATLADALDRVSTHELDDGGYASTVQTGASGDDSEHDDLDEATIERTIAEINEAIRRTAARKA